MRMKESLLSPSHRRLTLPASPYPDTPSFSCLGFLSASLSDIPKPRMSPKQAHVLPLSPWLHSSRCLISLCFLIGKPRFAG